MSINSSSDFYDEVNLDVPVIKIPKVGTQYSFPLNVLLIDRFIKQLVNNDNKNKKNGVFSPALTPPLMELLDANIWE